MSGGSKAQRAGGRNSRAAATPAEEVDPMPKKTNEAPSPVSPDLLEILRDPQAIQEGTRYGADPGRLELVRDYWLVSADTGYKYPIRDGIPVMLIEEGAKWKDTPVSALPVPPPPPDPIPVTRTAEVTPEEAASPGPNVGLLIALVAVVLALLVLIRLSRRRVANTELPAETLSQ